MEQDATKFEVGVRIGIKNLLDFIEFQEMSYILDTSVPQFLMISVCPPLRMTSAQDIPDRLCFFLQASFKKKTNAKNKKDKQNTFSL